MGFEPRQHLLEGSSLGLHDLSVIIFPNHGKAYLCQLDLQRARLRGLTVWNTRKDLDLMFHPTVY